MSWIQLGLTSFDQVGTSIRALSYSSKTQEPSSNTRFKQHSYTCCCCSCTARAVLERTSMMSRFPSLLHRKQKDTGPRSLDCLSATNPRRTRERRGQAVTATRALGISSSSTQRHLRNPRLEKLVHLLLLLFYCCVLLEHELEQHELEENCVLLQLQQKAGRKIYLQLKIRRSR